ncbi:YciE/YciF ferroxidase family protein [Mangrovicoccus algicola]|uniref:DUF892 family protein n=1 Tax=Mangrovicoccus algicola TaxID=2771008 RepID=A0A8J6ZDN5_9RHOB|nr:DUF892 family protein [Mangrovicoccus algicola]MBE3640025.1 DUF892 family protein [Mangrovicoccus algicola]
MALNSLKDVYLDQLQDLHSANDQAAEATVALARAATDPELIRALEDGVNGIAEGLERTAELCGGHGVEPTGEHCRGMEGLSAEAIAHGVDAAFGDPAARDAMIIAQYQRMVHYAVAGYGCLVAYANRLGLHGDAAALSACLDHTLSGDARMTRIAQTRVNAAAA